MITFNNFEETNDNNETMLTIGVQNPKPKYNFIRLFYSSQETLPPKCIGPLRGEEAEASLSDVRGGVQRQVGWWQDEEFYHFTSSLEICHDCEIIYP